MRGRSLGVLLCWMGSLGCVRGVLLSMGGKPVNLAKYLIDRPVEAVNTKVNVVGRRLLQTQTPPQCVVLGGTCSCSFSCNGLCTAFSGTLAFDGAGADMAIDGNMATTWITQDSEGLRWMRIDFKSAISITGGVVRGIEGPRNQFFEIWTGNDATAFPGLNSKCFQSSSVGTVYEMFSCASTARYMFIVSNYPGDYLEIAEVTVYTPSAGPSSALVNGVCVASITCPAGTTLQGGVCVCLLQGQSLVNGVCANTVPPKCIISNGLCGCSFFSECNVPTSFSSAGIDYNPLKAIDKNLGSQYMSSGPGTQWLKFNCPNKPSLMAGIIRSWSYIRSHNFQVWVGDNSASYTSNRMCFTSTLTNNRPAQDFYENFACNMSGSEFWIVIPNHYTYFMVDEMQLYQSGAIGQQLVNDTCVCPSGQGVNNGVCMQCPSGRYLSNGICMTYDPIACYIGSYCPDGYTAVQPCQAGYYCSLPSTKVICPINKYCPEGSSAPVLCPIYQVSPLGSSSVTHCYQCPDNSHVDGIVNSSNPVLLGFSIAPVGSVYQTTLNLIPGERYGLNFQWKFVSSPISIAVNVSWSCNSNNWELIFMTKNPKSDLYRLGTAYSQVYTDSFVPTCSTVLIRFGGGVSYTGTQLMSSTSYCTCNYNYALDSSKVCQFGCPANSYCIGSTVNTCPVDSTSPTLSSSINSCSCLGGELFKNNSCSCPDGYVKPTNYYNKFETMADVDKVPDMLYSNLITDTSQCKSGNCARWMDGYRFNTSVFPDPNVFSVSFWVKSSFVTSAYNTNFMSILDPTYNGPDSVYYGNNKNGVFMYAGLDDWRFSTNPGDWHINPLVGPGGYKANSWMYIVFTYSYGKIGTLYSAAYTPNQQQFLFSDGYKILTFNSFGPSSEMTFYVDELAFFPGVLSYNSILQIKNSPSLLLCTVCAANSYCENEASTFCPGNSTSVAGSTTISQCTCTNAQQSIINNKCSCPSGKFLSGGNCVTCPPGMVCAVTFDAAACSPGSYCPVGSITETPCQAGSYCATPSTQVQCPINMYCPASTVTPIACALNFISPAGSTLSTQCEAAVITVDFAVDGASVNINQTQFQRALPDNVALNSYEDVLVLTQGACPQGYYCPVDTTTAIPCPASTYNNDTNAVSVADCKTCLVGQYCPSASVLPISCAAGSYRIVEGAAQQSDCTVCPTGNYCPIQSVTPTNCSAGTYGPNTASTSDAACQACPAGEFCPIATTSPIACAAGSYRGTTGGTQQSDCDVCPLGQFCPTLSVTPTDCAAGSYRGTTGATNQADCDICTTGNYCPIKSVTPTNCPISTYEPVTGGTSQDSCLVCPTGQYCPIATTTPISCAAGSYRGSTGAGAQGDCTVCPTGNYCPIKSIDPVNCTAGTYNPVTAQTSSAACLACTAGDYCPVATTTPSLCPANTFTASKGAAICESCPVYSTSPVASTNCTCDAGHFHVVTITGSSSTQSRSAALQSTIYDGVSPTVGVLPTSVFMQSSGSSHMIVTKGATVTISSQLFDDHGLSVSVTLNMFSNIYKSMPYVLLKRDVDIYWPGQQYIDVIPMFATTAGQSTYAYSTGLTGIGSNTLVWDTTNVPSGVYFVNTPMPYTSIPLSVFVASPTPATITYSPSTTIQDIAMSIVAGCIGDTLILKKPTGATKYTATPLKDNYVSCISLTDANDPPAVTILANGLSPLTWVVAGIDDTMQCFVSYGPLDALGGFEPFALITVYPRPAALGAVSSSLACANCTSGYRADPGAQVCTECGLGYYSNPVSQTCTACPAGTKCPTTTTPAPIDCGVGNYQSQSTQSLCLACPVGQYCDLAITVTPIDCPAGSFRSTEGAASLADCQTCTPGNYCPIKSVNPTNCAAGSYRSTTGAQSQAQCDTCTTGNFCPIQSVNPTNCAAGSYRSTAGAESQAQCDTCTTGHYCPIQSVNPTNCLAGTYNPSTGGMQALDCLACPAGDFCPTATTTPTSCAAGSYRGEPGATSQTECTACPSGNFCPIQSVDPTNCSAGTYNPSTSSISITACLSCPLGDYCHVATTNPSYCSAGSYRGSVGAADQAECTVCPSGNFCPIQSINPVNCSSGTFRPTTAGAAISDCSVCATGKYSMAIASSTDCPLCPINYYCTNSITIKTCPTHTSSIIGSSSLLHCRCDQGFKCAYSKRITAVVTLNSTTSSFNNDVGGIKTAFINAVATAAGVSSNQVTINSVIAKGGGRRLLSLEEGFIDVFTSVEGAERLHKLDLHLSRHSLTLHQGHSWQEAHSLISTSIMRGPTLSTR